MTNTDNQPQAIYTKNLPQGSGSNFTPNAQTAGAPPVAGTGVPKVPGNEFGGKSNKRKTKKIFGVDSRAVMAVLGLLLFFIVGMAGVLISQKQRLDKTATAPTAPQSQPSANVIDQGSCTLTFEVQAPTTLLCGAAECDDDLNLCENGLTCIATSRGQRFCSQPEYADNCRLRANNDFPGPGDANNVAACCSVPTPTPTPVVGACGASNCVTAISDNNCEQGLVCVANDSGFFCSLPEYEDSCTTNATQDDSEPYCCTAPTSTPTPTPTLTPTPTPIPGECGSDGCTVNADCDGPLVCLTAKDGNNYCSMLVYEDACIANATEDDTESYCCTAPTATPTPTPAPTLTPTPTPEPTLPPGVVATSTPATQPTVATNPPATQPTVVTQTVITTVSCNNACTVNTDCTNLSHICYNGLCRLDSNPENEACQTPSGGTTVVIAQPTLPAELPVSGFADLANYFKIGLGALGAGILLLLFL